MKKHFRIINYVTTAILLFSSIITLPIGALADTHLDQDPLRFDLGTQDSPVRNGFVKVHELTEYSSEATYGFDEAREGDSRDQGDDLRADFILTNPHTFTVELDNGVYDVEIITGSNWDTNSTTYRFFDEEEERGGTETPGGDFEYYEDTVEVAEEYLNITFGGVWGRVNALILTAEGEEEPTWQFDFGTESSQVVDGFTKVPNVLIYDETDLPYGFDMIGNATPGARDQSFPVDLRDFVLASDNTFRADVENGDYLVRIVTGSQLDNDRTSYSILGGEVKGGERTEAGEHKTYEEYIHVENGQVDIAFSNEWARVNTIEIIPILRVSDLEVTDSSASEGFVELAWNESDFATSYNVFRQEDGESGMTQIATTDDAFYRDATVNVGYTYTYTVSANTDTNLESIQSEPVNVTMVDEEIDAPSRPEGLQLGNGVAEERVEFSWESVENASLYYVFRSRFAMDQFPHALESYERVAITEDTTFVDTDIHSQNPYYYFVQAVNEGGTSDRSDVIEAQPRNLPTPDYLNTEDFDVEVINNNGMWQALDQAENVLFEGEDVVEVVHSAFDSLTEGRTDQETVVLRDDAFMRFDQYIDVPSHTIFHVEGTIHVEENNEDFDYNNFSAAVRIMHRENVSIPQLNVTGSPNYGLFIRTSEDIFLGQIDLRQSGGHGVRIDSRDDDSVYGVRNVVVDNVYVSGTNSHGFETYGVDGITIGTVTAVDTGYAGVLLNDTINADLDMVYGYNAGAGTGYAAFRMANENGRINDDYDTNIFVGEVVARHGGRGIFSVSRSGGAEIDRIDIANTGNNAILLENGYNIHINGGIVEGASGIRISARNEFPNNWDILMQNLTVRNSSILEQPRGEDIRFRNITLENSDVDVADITFAEDDEEPGDPGEEEPGDPGEEEPGDPGDEESEIPAELAELIAELEGRIEALEDELSDVQEANEELRDELIELQSVLSSLQTELGETSDILTQLEERVNELEERLAQLENEEDSEISDEMAALIAVLEDRLAAIEEELSNSEVATPELIEELEALRNQLATLQEELGETNETVIELEARVSELEDSLAALEEDGNQPDEEESTDSTNNTGREERTDEDTETGGSEGERLPSTATTTWTVGLVGLLSLVAGVGTTIFKKKK